MAVHVTHADPIDPPVEAVELTDSYGTRHVVVRPCSSGDLNLRTIECVRVDKYGYATSFKFVQPLDNLERFGEALVRLARAGKAAL